MNKVYVVFVDESYDGDQNSFVLGTYATMELAKKRLEEWKADVKANSNFDTEFEDETSWSTYDEGWYGGTHYTIEIEEQNVEGGENRLTLEDVMLVDDPTSTGGKANTDETLSEFIATTNAEKGISLADLNKSLAECGIEPITDEQIIIKEGE